MNLPFCSRWLQTASIPAMGKWISPSSQTFKVMKLMITFLTVFLLHASAGIFGQNVTIKVKDAPLERVFRSIEKQTGYGFLYTRKMLDEGGRVTLDVRDEPVRKVLEKCLKQLPLSFSIDDNTIIISRSKNEGHPMADILSMDEMFKTITGTVKDEKGNAISGVSVVVKGTKRGTSTDKEGHFKIEANEGDVLEFSFVGYKKVSRNVGKSDHITVVMQISETVSSEIVVVGYGTQAKSTLTGSQTTLKPETYENAPRESVIESIQGNVPGVQTMNPSGQPGTSGNTRIRGIGSINASQTPLYIVDGVPVITTDVSGYGSNPLAGINPDDVASVSVLKDAAATSIYGSRAANGVIIITTKQGKAGKVKIHFSMQQGVNKLTLKKDDLPLNTSEMIELLREGWVNAGKDINDFIPELEDEEIDTTVNTDWVKALTRDGSFSQYNLSASGGTERTQFYSSAGYYQSKAALRGVDYKRGTAKLSVKSKVSDRLSFDAGMSGYYQRTHAVADQGGFANPVRSLYRLQPWLNIYNPDGSYDFSYNSTHNPVATYREVKRVGISYNVALNVGANLIILPGLTLEPKLSGDLTYGEGDRFYPPGFGDGRNVNGRGSVETNVYKNWISTNILRYKHKFNQVHSLEGFIGYEAQKIVASGNYAEATNFLPGLQTLNAASLPTSTSSSLTSHSLVGTFVNANYDYRNFIFLSASFRRDGSSRFGEKKRFANFWSIGAGWSIGKSLLDDVEFISDLKIRASYGINGNQGIGNFASRGLYGSGNDYNGEPGYVFSQYENPLLTWEQNKPFDIGLDFAFFNYRLTGSVDYYNRITSKLLLDVPISSTNGLTSYTVNYGAMRNSGWELSISSKNVVKKGERGFAWQTDFNLSTLKNEITELPSPLTSSTYKRDVGDNYYTFYLPAYAGVDPENGDALWYAAVDKSATTNKYGSAVRIKEGTALPKFFGGLTNKFSYGNFGLSFLFYYNWGNKIFDIWGRYTQSDGSGGFSATSSISRYVYEHRWQKPGDHTDVPKVVFKGKQSGSSSQTSTRFLYDGSYIRLRDITLSYDLPRSLANTLKIQGAQVYFRANNLFTYLKDNRLTFDPEVSIDGTLDQRPPVYKTLTVGINLNF